MRLRIGHLSTFYHTAMLLMADRELVSGIGAEIEWKLFGTGPAIINAFEEKEIDLAYVGLPPAIIGIERGVEIICIAGGHIEGTVVCARPPYKGFPEISGLDNVLRQFRGMTIGVPGKGSIHDVILQQSLRDAGLADDIAVRNFPWADMVLEAMVRNEVAAAFGTPALAVSIRRFAGGKIIWPAHKLWPDNPSYGIAVSRPFLEQNPKLIESFLLVHENATGILRNSPEQASMLIAGHVGFIDKDFVCETLKVSPKYCSKLTDSYISSTMAFVQAMFSLGYISRPVAQVEIFDPSLIRRVHPEKGHYEDGIRAA